MQRTAVVDVAIVGGGLSGLVAAYNLSPTTSFVLLEAHPTRLGGRILSAPAAVSPDLAIDLGPAWLWPRYQPHLRSLLTMLSLQTFPQPDDPSSVRIQGGSATLIAALAAAVPADLVRRNWALASVTHSADGVTLTSESGETVSCRHAILAVPPARLVGIAFSPPLHHAHAAAAARSRSWMAGVTKVALLFARRVWPLDGSSNLALRRSKTRPAFQVYDAGDAREMPAALTFFALASPGTGDDSALGAACAIQLAEAWEMRGLNAAATKALHSRDYKVVVQRWPAEPFVADETDPKVVHPHPVPDSALARPEWGDRLLFAGSEADARDPGVMEGAVGAAYAALEKLPEGMVAKRR